MADTFRNFVGGRWRVSPTGQTFANENPASKGSNLGFFQSSGASDVEDAINEADAAFHKWRRTTVAERQQYVGEFLRLLKESREELARIVTLENGKTLRESRAEVDSALIEGQYHLTQVSTFYGHTGPGAARDITTWVQYEPLGVVGVISPWNFPMNVMCRKTLPALLTGNTVVFKPASFTPWSGVFMASLFERAGLPAGVFNCVTGLGSSIGNRIVEDARVRAISFTGSTSVGKKIQAQAAVNLARTQLELGGKNALIVMADADLDAALDAAMTAGFSNAGQWCTSTSRILLHRPVAQSFLEKLVARCEKMSVADGLLDTTDMGPVAGPQQYDDIRRAICRAQTEGARMIAGDEVSPDLSRRSGEAATDLSRRSGEAATDLSRRSGEAATDLSRRSGEAATDLSRRSGEAATDLSRRSGEAATDLSRRSGEAATDLSRRSGEAATDLSRRSGEAAKAEGYFIRPTVFTGVRCDMELFREEVFGPVLAVMEFDSLDEALEIANNSIYGLSSALYTSDIRAARRYVDGIEAGLAHVNVHTGYKEPSMPFGGVKQSGAGLPENSESGLEAFVNRKAVYLRG